ncbi:MAG: SNF2 helicase-associated domain-containing protein, partial [Bacteroidales bacterium]|nr:SNF2 helicase-associated domain-containing protein [Bacteroidales bacterium]
MVMQFGKTWWGEQWLRSLANVDYDNRLPRGASYARNGYVKEVKIRDNVIKAKVAGSRPTPYRVTLIVPPFFEEEVDLFMQEIIKRPALISRLLNRELDPGLLSIAEEAGLRIFPRQWTDFKMQCTCPDWAVPCKHLASVIYMVSREIDNNPFLVFEIHKVKLLEELKKRGIFVSDPKKTEISKLSDLLKTKKRLKSDYDEEKVYGRVDFSTLNDISEALVHLLPDAPPFYPGGNFREKFSLQFLRIARSARRVLSRKLDFDALFPALTNPPEVNHHSTISLSVDSDHNIQVLGENHSLKKPDQLLTAVYRLNPGHLPDYQPSVAGLHKIILASLHLIANGNIVPQIVQLGNRQYYIRWLPALIESEVRLMTGKMEEILPPGLLLSPKTVSGTRQLLPLENQTNELLSIVVTELVARFSGPSNGNLFEDFFFKNKAYPFTGVGENALSGGVKVWLDRFHITTENYKPVITVTELHDERFDVRVSIEDKSDAESLPIPVAKILKDKQYEKQRFKILQSLSLLSPFIKGLDMHINSGGSQPIIFDVSEFAPFLMEMLPAVRLLDIKIMLPKSLQELIRPKATVKLRRNAEQQGYVRLDDLLSFDWQVALGDT